MERKEFLRNSLIIGGASVLPANSLLAATILEGGIDKLMDGNGHFIQQPLPYSENFLEPSMDAETIHLHYTFHHGGAVKAANDDLKKIKEVIDIWEHAYYLKYKNKRADFVDALFPILIWDNVASRLDTALKMTK